LQKLETWIRIIIRAGGDYERFYALVCEGIKDLANADIAMLPLIDEGRNTFTYRAAAGEKAATVLRKTIPLESGLCGWVAVHGEVLCVPDLFQCPLTVPDLIRALDVTTGLIVPLSSQEGFVGGLSAFRKGQPFDHLDVQLLTLFSHRITTALENMHLLRTLENRVAERTAALTEANAMLHQEINERSRAEEKLHRYAEELQQANEDMKSFAYIVSHDLRAPLVNIKGFAQELLHGIEELGPLFEQSMDGYPEKERRKFSEVLRKDIPEALTFIGSSVNRMDNLITAVLKLSRAGQYNLNPEPLRTREVVQGILNTLAHQIESRKITVSLGELPQLVADRTAIEQIFGNLLDNAVKYLVSDRPGRIAISGEHSDGKTVFHVRDNGRGMAKEDIPKAFEVFRRVGRQDVPGEGMGLAFVKTLVRLLGGRIWCESEPGQGTTFSFTLPRTDGPAPQNSGPSQ